MDSKKNGFLLFLLVLPAIVASQPGHAIPPQKLHVGLPFTSYTKATASPEGSASESLPMGFSGEYSLFLARDLAISGQFGLNLETSELSIVLMGGKDGLNYFFLGGANRSHRDNHVESLVTPNLNVWAGGGLAARTFDWRVIEKPAAGKVKKRDKKDPPQGSVIGVYFNVGLEYPLSKRFTPGTRFQYVYSFSSQTTPDLTIMEIWFSIGFNV